MTEWGSLARALSSLSEGIDKVARAEKIVARFEELENVFDEYDQPTDWERMPTVLRNLFKQVAVMMQDHEALRKKVVAQEKLDGPFVANMRGLLRRLEIAEQTNEFHLEQNDSRNLRAVIVRLVNFEKQIAVWKRKKIQEHSRRLAYSQIVKQQERGSRLEKLTASLQATMMTQRQRIFELEAELDELRPRLEKAREIATRKPTRDMGRESMREIFRDVLIDPEPKDTGGHDL